ncbi:hypothetical protein AB0M28_13710 [Streptomyces sp. NPDC051940]|uniref:hypothetical protein n=1 Tax=Streptomyces sp. NPDC051940 TaxID=3155675 RepID=UPI003422760F
MTEVHVEQGDLDNGIGMVFRDFGRRVRMCFDPRVLVEAAALALLCQFLPRLVDAMTVMHVGV